MSGEWGYTGRVGEELWTYFTSFSSISNADFEQVNVRWEITFIRYRQI